MERKQPKLLKSDISKSAALKFIILLAVTSLFADMTFEATHSITGPFLATLGASAALVGFGAHESLMRAIVANMISSKKRASAYGIFNAGFGVFWFLGSITIGFLYDHSVLAVVIFSLITQLLAVPLFFWVKQRI